MVSLKVLRGLGDLIDRRYLKKAGATSVPGSQLQLLLVCYHAYEGKKQLTIEDQTTINPGEQIGEFHLSNIRITEIADESSTRPLEWRLLQMLKAEFVVLAEACVNGIIPEHVQAFYGVNVLVAGAKRLGFSLIPISKGWNRWWLGFWESLLRLIYYSFRTKKKASLQRTMDPYEVWISRAELIRRYYPKANSTLHVREK